VVDPADVDAVKRAVSEVFENVTDPETEASVFGVRDGAELFPRDDTAPDLVLDVADGYTLKTTLADDPFDGPGSYAADHRNDGIFLAWGSAVDSGAHISDAHVVDVAPTLLHGARTALPDHLDGDVLTDVFAPDSAPAEADVKTAAGDSPVEQSSDDRTDSEAVEERLRGLGYIE